MNTIQSGTNNKPYSKGKYKYEITRYSKKSKKQVGTGFFVKADNKESAIKKGTRKIGTPFLFKVSAKRAY